MTITLRNTTQSGATNKGSTLTIAELDGNFVDLLTNKVANPIAAPVDAGDQQLSNLAIKNYG